MKKKTNNLSCVYAILSLQTKYVKTETFKFICFNINSAPNEKGNGKANSRKPLNSCTFATIPRQTMMTKCTKPLNLCTFAAFCLKTCSKQAIPGSWWKTERENLDFPAANRRFRQNTKN